MSEPFSDTRPFGYRVSLQRPALVPEIALWLIEAQLDLETACASLRESEAPPYWAFCWGAGQALARYVLDNPHEVAEAHVVDFGAGSGVAGIAAALSGATAVTFVDIDPTAREATLANAAANGSHNATVSVTDKLPRDIDVLLASDVVYERQARAHLGKALRSSRTTLGAEPHRPGLVGLPENPLAHYQVRTHPDVDPPTQTASVYRLTPSSLSPLPSPTPTPRAPNPSKSG